MSPGLTHAAASSRPARPTVTAAAVTVPLRPSGDLDSGSVTHSLAAGNRSVVIDYWTTGDAKTWRAQDTKTIQLSAHIEGGGSADMVKVTRFLATADDGTTRTSVVDDRGEFVITPPFTYSTALNVLPSAAHARKLTLYVQFDLLVETAPDSGTFFRQTVLDSLALPLLQEDPK
ncbi:MAG TPA: hypothetical protein VGN47_08425 [Blastococcus sp.]|jgi:hypothetical protein|nr:hypothetical protein [Blastococcus sp.]